MIRLLLDTHVFLWWLNDDPRLNRKARLAIADPAGLVHVSAAVIWEIAIKINLGRLKVRVKNLPAEIAANGFLDLAVSSNHAFAAGSLPLHHSDPFDRMIVAQAQLETLTIVTHDKAFGRYRVPVLWT